MENDAKTASQRLRQMKLPAKRFSSDLGDNSDRDIGVSEMTMKHIQLAVCFILVQTVTAVRAQEPDEAKLAKQRADTAVRLGQEHAADYAIYRHGHRDAELKLHPAATLRFTNPVPQEVGWPPQELYGAVFLWTNQGRPEVVFSILNVYSPGTPFVVHELTSLSDHRVVAERDGTRQWYPDRAGIKRMSVPDAPGPAETARRRLVQMRVMSRQFAANKTDGKRRATELRLLSKPLYRYESSDPAVTDGALFAFVDGTDPEVLLMLEARRDDGADQWYFATARLNILHVRLFHQKRKVWEAPYLTRTEWSNREAPYVLVHQPATESAK